MVPEDNSFEQGYDSSDLEMSTPDRTTTSDSSANESPFRFHKVAFLITACVLLLILLIGIGSLLFNGHSKKSTSVSGGNSFGINNLSLSGLPTDNQLAVNLVDHLAV